MIQNQAYSLQMGFCDGICIAMNFTTALRSFSVIYTTLGAGVSHLYVKAKVTVCTIPLTTQYVDSE